MNRERTLDSIPCDLFLDIFSRLPAKSIGRCRCVSRLWGSMIRGPYFTELFLTRSSASPRLLFAVKRNREWLFFSSPQPQNLYEKWPLVVAADFHTKFSEDINEYICRYSSGLIHFSDRWISKEEVICNPITGQYTILPKLMSYGVWRSVVVFDPIDKHHKVLRMNCVCYNETVHYIMTLGTEKLTWRKIQCRPLSYRDGREGICINGVYYYFAVRTDKEYYETHVIVCFDVRSEIFKFIEVESFYNSQLMNYKGKLVAINLMYNDSCGRLNLELHTWVLEDVEKHESSKCVYSLWTSYLAITYDISVVGVTATGDIVLSNINTFKPCYVLYFNPERNTVQHVGIRNHEVLENANIVYTFVDHVEDLTLNNIMKTTYDASTSISPPKQTCKPTRNSHIQVSCKLLSIWSLIILFLWLSCLCSNCVTRWVRGI